MWAGEIQRIAWMFCFDCSTHRVQYNLSALKLTPRKTTDEGSTVKTTTLNVSAARQRIVQRPAISPAFLSIRQKDELVPPSVFCTPHRVQYNLSALKLTPRKTTDEVLSKQQH